jgi:hypothetical protein
LLFGRNANPDSHGFSLGRIFLHTTGSYQKTPGKSEKKV